MYQSFLKQVLHYESETGKWTWLVSTTNAVKIGQQAGIVSKRGHRYI